MPAELLGTVMAVPYGYRALTLHRSLPAAGIGPQHQNSSVSILRDVRYAQVGLLACRPAGLPACILLQAHVEDQGVPAAQALCASPPQALPGPVCSGSCGRGPPLSNYGLREPPGQRGCWSLCAYCNLEVHSEGGTSSPLRKGEQASWRGSSSPSTNVIFFLSLTSTEIEKENRKTLQHFYKQ
jgi:hypothetical protein